MNSKVFRSDFLVIGSGIAGLTFAIKASELGTVHLVTKKKDSDSNTNYAQGGIASVLSPDDSIESHIADTLKTGAGLCNEDAVRLIVENGPSRIAELSEWGTKFSMKKDSTGKEVFDLGREGGHSKNRIVHARDLTGQELERALLDKISTIRNITIFEDHTAVDLLTEHQLGRDHESAQKTCYGAYIMENSSGDIHSFIAPITMLASGGVGQIYQHTTNPEIATGDGIAMAYRAGALVGDMEFIQFHPTSLYHKGGGRSFLISEAVRGEGAILTTISGKRFMDGIHTMKELAPRDIVARTIDSELKKSGEKYVLLDISFKGEAFLRTRFPAIFQKCMEEGIDISKEPIPVVPAAHYLCGGIITDRFARSSIKNLFVSGESACTGVHGANRLASNSLLEGIVYSHSAAEYLRTHPEILKSKDALPEFPLWNKEGTFDLEEWILIQHNKEDVKRLMWDYVGIVRTNLRLQRAQRRIKFLSEEIYDYYRRSTLTLELVELRNLVTVAGLIIEGALHRKESRGLHHNTDYPETKDEYCANIILQAQSHPLLKKHREIEISW